MPALEPLPPLVPDSVTAKLLYEIWSGNRLVRGWPGTGDADVVSVVVAIAAHLHIRAGFSVLVVGSPDHMNECRSGLEQILPGETFSKRSPKPGRPPSVKLTHPSRDPDVYTLEDPFDLVIMSNGSMWMPQYVLAGLAAGRQLLTFGPIGRLELGDRTGLDVPLDVAFAGGTA